PWFQLGKSRITPVAETTAPRITMPSQNHIFSPALNFPDGISGPPNMPPAPLSQLMSYDRGRLSFTYSRNITTSVKMKSGPTKLCRFLLITVSHENPVYPSHGRMTCLPQRITKPESARKMKHPAITQWEA